MFSYFYSMWSQMTYTQQWWQRKSSLNQMQLLISPAGWFQWRNLYHKILPVWYFKQCSSTIGQFLSKKVSIHWIMWYLLSCNKCHYVKFEVKFLLSSEGCGLKLLFIGREWSPLGKLQNILQIFTVLTQSISIISIYLGILLYCY